MQFSNFGFGLSGNNFFCKTSETRNKGMSGRANVVDSFPKHWNGKFIVHSCSVRSSDHIGLNAFTKAKPDMHVRIRVDKRATNL